MLLFSDSRAEQEPPGTYRRPTSTHNPLIDARVPNELRGVGTEPGNESRRKFVQIELQSRPRV